MFHEQGQNDYVNKHAEEHLRVVLRDVKADLATALALVTVEDKMLNTVLQRAFNRIVGAR